MLTEPASLLTVPSFHFKGIWGLDDKYGYPIYNVSYFTIGWSSIFKMYRAGCHRLGSEAGKRGFGASTMNQFRLHYPHSGRQRKPRNTEILLFPNPYPLSLWRCQESTGVQPHWGPTSNEHSESKFWEPRTESCLQLHLRPDNRVRVLVSPRPEVTCAPG